VLKEGQQAAEAQRQISEEIRKRPSGYAPQQNSTTWLPKAPLYGRTAL
jgi:hypothetical protein